MADDRAGATPARRAALSILEQCRRGRRFEQALEESGRGLPERDRRLAHELAAGVLRDQGNLDQALAPLVPRGWDSVAPPLQDILRLGAYQLRRLDRVPRHAAVATSVTLARESSGERASGFVNAVLRRLAHTPLPEAPTSPDPAADATHPAWLVERWLARYGPADTARLIAWNNTRPRLAVQPAREPLDTLIAAWHRQGFATEPVPGGDGVYVSARRPDHLEGFERGAFLVQDPAQAWVVRFAGLGNRLVYDACASPGGKTLGLSHHGARVVAGDRSRLRVARMAQNIRRAGHGREWPLVADARHPPVGRCDAVLLDAPCLGTGTLARHPDARWRIQPDALGKLVTLQRDLIEALAPIVPVGGILVYATCSLEPEENECQVEDFLARHPEFHREANPEIPADLRTPAGDLAILPFRHRMDGAYSARLRRTAP